MKVLKRKEGYVYVNKLSKKVVGVMVVLAVNDNEDNYDLVSIETAIENFDYKIEEPEINGDI
jgi:hypothetical protein